MKSRPSFSDMDEPDKFFRLFRNNITEVCRKSHAAIYNDILDNYVCWGVTDSLWHILSDISEPIYDYKGTSVDDIVLALNTYITDSHLINIAYEPDGMYTHWFSVVTDGEYCYTIEYSPIGVIMTTMNNEDFMNWITAIISGKIPDRFYGVKLQNPEVAVEVYKRKPMNSI